MSRMWLVCCLVIACLPGVGRADSEPSLAQALFEEGDWSACVLECRRMETETSGLPDIRALRERAEAKLSARPAASSGWRKAGSLPIRGLVGFYRLFVASAIGSRCVLEPSCSRYALEAAKKAGLLSIPMTGDRLIREPSVVSLGEKPVTDAQNRVRYADPVSDHAGCRH